MKWSFEFIVNASCDYRLYRNSWLQLTIDELLEASKAATSFVSLERISSVRSKMVKKFSVFPFDRRIRT